MSEAGPSAAASASGASQARTTSVSPGKSAEWNARQAHWYTLLNRISKGDQSAMATLYDETSQLVYSLALRTVGNSSDAEEVTMDVYNQVWRNADRYTSDRGTVFAWLLNIARSRAIDHLRSRRSRAKANEPLEDIDVVRDAADGPERLSEMSQQRERVRAALSQLPADQKRCIEMAFFAGLSHSELAERLGEPLGTIKTRIRSGMMKLRTALGEFA